MNIAILGAGAWGTALALAFAPRHRLTLWTFETEHAAAIRAAGENVRFLPGHALPAGIPIESDIAAALGGAELAIIATPVAGLRTTLQAAAGLPVLWVCKGLEAGTGLLPHQVAAQVASAAPSGALTGPSFAEEVARGLPTAITLASADAGFARDMAQALHTPRLRLYANDDIVGAEVGGAVKNVLAIATGICDGLGLGLNARAALMTRGLAEITRFGAALGARRETFMGLAGMGDLILTCTGDLSRNRRVGLALASGRPLEAITRELGHVAEGVMTAREVALRAASLGVDMPITAAVCAVIDGRIDARQAVDALMNRDPKAE
ncbi:MAG: NAD(P)-dependent glycerol-3-phosphate dehydrogenase [Gammaproteobacteria bacterium]|nr:NAD(P)-dependent glycerol-3-phosphate dehydrogenase [Gammaproteobacteria bacterium]MBU1645890.1 NAD(P)-dependent glycerol-3-phosphate dehydrogenase [Gammaproteobacteria bacterium]MBU1971952.1 NAD(P)-dependent glycerol-3-phosphate dehydrogenase [Gammaproteobacteria bacterium]